jgi:hypothetical protein
MELFIKFEFGIKTSDMVINNIINKNKNKINFKLGNYVMCYIILGRS